MSEAEVATAESSESSEARFNPLDTDQRARNMGWRPKEEFRGDASKWRDAAEYIRVAEENLPVMNERFRALEGRNQTILNELQRSTKTIGELQQTLLEQRDHMVKTEDRALALARRELLAKRDAAVAHADTETYKEVQGQIDDLNNHAPERPRTQERQAQAPTTDPAVVAWVGENPWFNNDTDLHWFAKNYDSRLMGERPGMSVSERLAAVKTETMRLYPSKFQNPLRESAPSVTEPNAQAPSPRKRQKTYADLPADAQKACDRLVQQLAEAAARKPGSQHKSYTREDYTREYFLGEE